MKLPIKTTTIDSAARLKRAQELDAKIRQSLAETKISFANLSKSDFPPDWIDLAAYEEFFKTEGRSLGTTLTPADEIGFNTLGFYMAAGAVISRESVLDWLAKFNPARAEAVAL